MCFLTKAEREELENLLVEVYESLSDSDRQEASDLVLALTRHEQETTGPILKLGLEVPFY